MAANRFTAKAPWEKYERPRLTVPPGVHYPQHQKTVTCTCTEGYTTMDRTSYLSEDGKTFSNDNRLPWERNYAKYYDPNVICQSKFIPSETDLSGEDFFRMRRIKDLQPDKVPRVPNIIAYNSSPAMLPHFNLYGVQRDPNVYTHHPDYRDFRCFPKPTDVGYYGFQHERLDRHNTGEFWNSRKHT